MSDNPHPDYEKQIGDAIRNTVNSGDLSHLKELGGAVQGAVQSAFSSSNTGQNKNENEADNSPSSQNVPFENTTERWLKTKASKNNKPKPIFAKKGLGVPSLIFGSFGLFCFGLSLVLFTVVAFLSALPAIGYLPGAITMGVFTALSSVLFASGIGKRGFVARLRQYARLFGEKQVWSLEALSTATQIPSARVRRDLRKALDNHLLYDVQMDVGETCVFYGAENYRLYLESEQARERRELEEAERQNLLENPDTAPIEHFRKEGQNALQQLKKARQDIDDADFSQKLERLEATTGRIFSYVEAHPEKLPATHKFMEYYLPTTLKLVAKYHQYELEGLQMENILLAKKDISKSLDTIDIAFNNLLKTLYHEDTLDVVTDIDVLETMLEQEGLTRQTFEIDLK